MSKSDQQKRKELQSHHKPILEINKQTLTRYVNGEIMHDFLFPKSSNSENSQEQIALPEGTCELFFEEFEESAGGGGCVYVHRTHTDTSVSDYTIEYKETSQMRNVKAEYEKRVDQYRLKKEIEQKIHEENHKPTGLEENIREM